ncbi:MAG TPA: type I secretion system permease/ATPase [Deltaproteobacteria bacterium]|nr:type I secretion system permease/ATPase [Deltaproteobacteria bacterium]
MPENNKLYEFLLSYKKVIFNLFIFSGIMSFLSIVPALYMFQIYDSVLMSRNVNTLLMLTLIVVFMYVLFGFLEWSRSRILIALSNDIDRKLKDKVFHAVLNRIILLGSNSPSQAFGDLTTLRQFLSGTGLFAFLDLPWTPIYMIVIFIIHPLLGVFSIISALILLGLALLNEGSTRKPLRESNKHYQSANSFLQANLRNTEVIEAMGMHGSIKSHWLEKYNPVLKLQEQASKRASVLQSCIRASRIAFQSLMLGTGAYLAIDNIITPGEMIMASILMGKALSPVDVAVSTWKNFVNARESYDRLSEVLSSYEENLPSVSLPPPKGSLSVENIMVKAPNSNTAILKGVNFSAAPGELIAIIGPTAAGKSTLAKTTVGIWRPFAGTVRLDGAELSQYDKEDLGKYLGYLPQDIELFDGTIAENIARFGKIESEKVIRAAQIAGIHDFILRLPEGYDMPIGEAGNYLSGGQRQRIALARALYGDPPLILLDEPNSNLDEQGEAALLSALSIMKKLQKTVIVVSHRTNILRIMDKILLMANGTVVAFGPKEEVLRKISAQKPPQRAQQSISK